MEKVIHCYYYVLFPVGLFCPYVVRTLHGLVYYNFLVVSVLYTQHNKPLYSFEDSVDYVYDVMWSPVHPAVFATVDGIGRLDIWNLNKDKEVSKVRFIRNF